MRALAVVLVVGAVAVGLSHWRSRQWRAARREAEARRRRYDDAEFGA